jgi:DNA-binding MarR family transcriptional regulator
MRLLGLFNDDLTRVFDDVFGTQWAEMEEMLAITAIAADPRLTTRRLAEITRMNRRAVSRMIVRMHSDRLVVTRPSDADGRAVHVALTGRGEERVEALQTAITELFLDSTTIAREISDQLGPVPEAPTANAQSEVLGLLRRVCEAGLSLVGAMPDAARRGQLAARQRAALVQIATMGGARPHELSVGLEVSRAGIAYIVDQLCAKGYATRRRGVVPHDRRAVIVEVTPEGMDAVHAVMNGIEAQREVLALLFSELAAWRPPARCFENVRGGAEAAPSA